MDIHQTEIEVATSGQGMIDITARVQAAVASCNASIGLVQVFCQHTSCSLIIQENADPAVQVDLLAWLARLAPEGDPRFTHTAEGPDDMPAHLRTVLTRTSETIPLRDGSLWLGTWQGLYLIEHRARPHRRTVLVQVMSQAS